MQRKFLLAVLAVFLLGLLQLPTATAQRVYDEFDAPVINAGRNYVDYSVAATSFGRRYTAPMTMSNDGYKELAQQPPFRVVYPDPSDVDNGYFQLELPFTIHYNGTTFVGGGTGSESLWISVNGFVVIGGQSEPGEPGTDPTLLFSDVAPYNVIAPYWGNHRYRVATETGFLPTEVSWQLEGVAPHRKITIQWKNLNVNVKVQPEDAASVANFQVVIHERNHPTTIFPASTFNRQPDIDLVYGRFGGNGPIDPSYYVGASAGLKGTTGNFINALSYVNPLNATTSQSRTQFWPVSGSSTSYIRFETYQRSVIIPAQRFESTLTPVDPLTGYRTDRDDGAYRIDLTGLSFNFNFLATKQNSLWVNVNGFTTFQTPQSSIVNDNPNGLFENSSSYPNNAVAPFWGDHYLRIAGEDAVPASNGRYLPSEISYVVLGSYPNRRLVVQWKNLNIMNEMLPSSIGNFQAIYYEGYDEKYPNNFAGGIEFAYGDVSNNPNTTLTTVQVVNASVGIKGGQATGINPLYTDFINGLLFDNIAMAFRSRQLTVGWRPSGGPNNGEGRRIFFRAVPRLYTPGWGDGDADLSQTRIRKHSGQVQNRFVTASDARLVLRWVLKDRTLPDSLRRDSLRLGNNYHADVNHNGRYYYSARTFDNLSDRSMWRRPIDVDTFGMRVRRDSAESLAGLPPDAGPLRLIYYEANTRDASDILSYLSGRIPSFPWIFDTIPSGKATEDYVPYASDIEFGTAKKVGLNEYEVPVKLNGISKYSLAIDFQIDGEILSIKTDDNLESILTDHNLNVAAIASSEDFDKDEPVAYIRFTTDKSVLTVTNIALNERVRTSKQISLLEEVSAFNGVAPNPTSDVARFTFNLGSQGSYTFTLTDVTGQVVYQSFIDSDANGQIIHDVNVANLNLASGAYYAVVRGNGKNEQTSFNVLR